MDSIQLCSVEGCGKPRKSRGWCSTHYERWRRNGDPLVARVYGGAGCSVDGCANPHEARGWCQMHLQRWIKSGSLAAPVRAVGEMHHRWRGKSIGYFAAHMRVRSARGPAKLRACEHCGARASDWAYTHVDPAEICSDQGAYSSSPDFYIALCRGCHVRFDKAWERKGISA